jgi:hypothetical protein
MKTEDLIALLGHAIDSATRTRETPVDRSDFMNLRLYGSGAIFDSMQLVNFLVLVEQMLEDDLGCVVSLTSEKAVSRRVSPFASIRTLVEFIREELSRTETACA